MARMNARMMRGKMALEVAAEIYSRHMFSLGNVVTVSIKPSSKEEQFPPITLGINGDVMGGMQAPVEVAKQHVDRSEEHTSELQSRGHLVCRLLLEKKKKNNRKI